MGVDHKPQPYICGQFSIRPRQPPLTYVTRTSTELGNATARFGGTDSGATWSPAVNYEMQPPGYGELTILPPGHLLLRFVVLGLVLGQLLLLLLFVQFAVVLITGVVPRALT